MFTSCPYVFFSFFFFSLFLAFLFSPFLKKNVRKRYLDAPDVLEGWGKGGGERETLRLSLFGHWGGEGALPANLCRGEEVSVRTALLHGQRRALLPEAAAAAELGAHPRPRRGRHRLRGRCGIRPAGTLLFALPLLFGLCCSLSLCCLVSVVRSPCLVRPPSVVRSLLFALPLLFGRFCCPLSLLTPDTPDFRYSRELLRPFI
jgi:hypothetical protein